jgi:hypothetical protein
MLEIAEVHSVRVPDFIERAGVSHSGVLSDLYKLFGTDNVRMQGPVGNPNYLVVNFTSEEDAPTALGMLERGELPHLRRLLQQMRSEMIENGPRLPFAGPNETSDLLRLLDNVYTVYYDGEGGNMQEHGDDLRQQDDPDGGSRGIVKIPTEASGAVGGTAFMLPGVPEAGRVMQPVGVGELVQSGPHVLGKYKSLMKHMGHKNETGVGVFAVSLYEE